jgi:hypothetical protein
MLVFLMVARIAILVLLCCQCGALPYRLWCSYVASVVYLCTDCDAAELSVWLPDRRVHRVYRLRYSFVGSVMSLYIEFCTIMYLVLCPYRQIVVQLCCQCEVFIYRSCTSMLPLRCRCYKLCCCYVASAVSMHSPILLAFHSV